jgi:hypothetical protein
MNSRTKRFFCFLQKTNLSLDKTASDSSEAEHSHERRKMSSPHGTAHVQVTQETYAQRKRKS